MNNQLQIVGEIELIPKIYRKPLKISCENLNFQTHLFSFDRTYRVITIAEDTKKTSHNAIPAAPMNN